MRPRAALVPAGMSSCIACASLPFNAAFTGVTGLTTNLCPWACGTGFFASTADVRACAPCGNGPAHASYTGPGSSAGTCPWQCTAGYYLAVASCAPCPTGTYGLAPGKLPVPLPVFTSCRGTEASKLMSLQFRLLLMHLRGYK